MTQKEFNEKAEGAIRDYFAEGETINVIPVWYAYVLGNIKGLFVVANKNGVSGYYIEVTYSASKNDFQMDVYYKYEHLSL